MRLNYNTAVFGTNITNRVTVTINGDAFNTNTYSTSVSDATSSQLSIMMGLLSYVASPSRTQLTTTSVRLFNVRIQLDSGRQGIPANLSFADTGFTSTLSLFAPASNTPWEAGLPSYTTTNYTPPPSFSIITVPPTISTNFSSITTRAGTGESIVINGNHFGTQRGQVLFTRAGIPANTDDFLRGLDDEYIVSWTDTRIEVIVPSFVRRGYLQSNFELAPGHNDGAGSGRVRVRTARNDSVTSPNNVNGRLNIQYSLQNWTTSPVLGLTPICKIYLARLSDCADMVFTFHNSFQSAHSSHKCNFFSLQI